MKSGVKIFIGTLLCLVIVVWGGLKLMNNVQFNVGAGGHLTRAANSNTVELATQEMDIAIKYIEENNLTKGYTSVLYKTPDEDIEFWYNNLKSAQNELKKVDPNATQLEKSNLLMKLRETLLDSGDKGQHLTVPQGISVYPNNLSFLIFGWLSLILLFIGCTMIALGVDEL